MATDIDLLSKGWYLEGELTDGKKWVVPLDPLPFVIGRHKTCGLSLLPKNISRKHAEFYVDVDSLVLKDLGSTNGTYVNHKRINAPSRLKTGDVIHFGTLEFDVRRRDVDDRASGESTMLHMSAGPKSYTQYSDDFREMMEQRAVVPYFQPIIKLPTFSTIGYEVLGRAFFKKLPSNPIELFKIASILGCEGQLSEVFRYEGVRAGLSMVGSPNLFLNSHPVEMYKINLLQSLTKVRKIAPALPITIEINEKAVSDLTLMKQLRVALNDLNIGLAYDDFGAGQARFIELIDVPPDYLKFDIALISKINKAPPRFQKMVASLVKMAKDLDIDTVAEGVETKEECEVCREIGFDYAQGYYFGKPSPVKVT